MTTLTRDDLEEFRAWVRQALLRIAPLDRTRVMAAQDPRDVSELWQRLAELGVLGIVDEIRDGFDGALAHLAVCLSEAARQLVPVPLLSTAFVTPLAIQWAGQTERFADLLSGIAAGRLRCGIALSEPTSPNLPTAVRGGSTWQISGHVPLVVDGDLADQLLIRACTDAGPAPFIVDVTGCGTTRTTLRSVDITRPVAALDLVSAPARPLGNRADAAARQADVDDAIRLALAAEAVGASHKLLEMAVDYAKSRRQFGRPIGSFQAVKHLCADLFTAVQVASATVEAAFGEIDQMKRPRSVTVLVASISSQETFCRAARTAMQIHGGVALTWEHELHLFLKRATASQHLLGNPDRQVAALCDAVLADEYDVAAEIIG